MDPIPRRRSNPSSPLEPALGDSGQPSLLGSNPGPRQEPVQLIGEGLAVRLGKRRRAIRHLEKGRVVIFGAGTGNPYFTTDTAGSLRAIEIKANIILKGTRVDGIYSADPEKDLKAKRFQKISFEECISKNLKVMDMTAFTLCMENKLPIVVFDMNKPGNLMSVVTGEKVGTLVS